MGKEIGYGEEVHDDYELIDTSVDDTNAVRAISELSLEKRVVLFFAMIFYRFDPLKSDTNLVNAYFAYLKGNLSKNEEDLSLEQQQAIKEVDRIYLVAKVLLGVGSTLTLAVGIFVGLAIVNAMLSNHESYVIEPPTFN